MKRRSAMVLGAVVALVTLSACGGSDAAEKNPAGLERTRLTVATLPIPDGAPLFIAVQKGFFKEEGLTVKPEIIQSGPLAIPKLQAGQIQFQLNNYVSAFSAEEKGVIKFKFVADSYQSAANAFNIVVPSNSKIKEAKDLAGKTIAVPGLNTIGTLAISAALEPVGVKADQVKFVEMPFPTMQAALKSKQVDAAWVTEPFSTAAQSQIGARKVVDTMSGPTAGLPIAGWGTTEKFANENPRTVAAFQRAMAKAQQLAATDREAVQTILPTYTKIDAKVAKVIALGEYPTSLNAVRLQRVSDLMAHHGMLKAPVDSKRIIYTAK